MLNVDDLLQTGDGGKGNINILVADKLMQSPKVGRAAAVAAVGTGERLPEVGDPDKPKLCSSSARRTAVRCAQAVAGKIEQVVRLIRSRAGRFFVTQNRWMFPTRVGTAWKSRAARCAPSTARSEGGEGGRDNHARIRSSIPKRQSRRSGSAKPWCLPR
jgi:hypothetical protein